jgi:hypothetical protein
MSQHVKWHHAIETMPRALFFGTCRVIETAKVLQRQGMPVTFCRHRLHTLRQIEQALSTILREPGGLEDEWLYLLSDLAHADVIDKALAPRETREYLEFLRHKLSNAEVLVFEISSAREHVFDGKVLNNFSTRDIRNSCTVYDQRVGSGIVAQTDLDRVKVEHSTDGMLSRQMAQLCHRFLEQHIIWVTHGIPPRIDTNLDHLIAVRQRLRDVVRAFCKIQSKRFSSHIDPSDHILKLGKRAWSNPEDYYHYSEELTDILAQEFVETSRLILNRN